MSSLSSSSSRSEDSSDDLAVVAVAAAAAAAFMAAVSSFFTKRPLMRGRLSALILRSWYLRAGDQGLEVRVSDAIIDHG